MNELLEMLAEQGVDGAIDRYRKIKEMAGATISSYIDAEMINNLGKLMLEQGHLKEAILFLEFSVDEFPDSRPAALNLSTAYYAAGDTVRARYFQNCADSLAGCR